MTKKNARYYHKYFINIINIFPVSIAGWMVLGVCLVVLGSMIGMFPHTLPSAKRRMQREAAAKKAVTPTAEVVEVPEASLKGKGPHKSKLVPDQ